MVGNSGNGTLLYLQITNNDLNYCSELLQLISYFEEKRKENPTSSKFNERFIYSDSMAFQKLLQSYF